MSGREDRKKERLGADGLEKKRGTTAGRERKQRVAELTAGKRRDECRQRYEGEADEESA